MSGNSVKLPLIRISEWEGGRNLGLSGAISRLSFVSRPKSFFPVQMRNKQRSWKKRNKHFVTEDRLEPKNNNPFFLRNSRLPAHTHLEFRIRITKLINFETVTNLYINNSCGMLLINVNASLNVNLYLDSISVWAEYSLNVISSCFLDLS